jgi:hypothetical protein
MENGLNVWDLLHGLQMWHVSDFSVDILPVPVVPCELQWYITEAVKQVTQDMLQQICKEWNYWDIAEQASRHVLNTWISFNPLNAELNPICHLLTLLGAHHILHVSRIRVNFPKCYVFSCQCNFRHMHSIVLQLSSRVWATMHMYTVYDSVSGHFKGVVIRSQSFCNFCVICLLKIVKCKTILPLCCIWLQCLLFLISVFVKY